MTDTEVAGPALTRDDFAVLYPRLRRFAAVVGPIDAEPDDLVQEALAALLRRGRMPEHPEAFLRTSILNLAIDQSRKRARWRRRLPLLMPVSAAQYDAYPSDAAVLERLDPLARVIVWLLDVERRSSTEVARMLDMRDATVRQQAARARKRLRREIESEEQR